jgi:uncharacterized protein
MLDYLSEIWRNNLSNHPIPLTYVSFYGGEPLLNMEVIKQTVDYVERLNVDREFVFSMTTNAILLDKYMDYLAEKDFSLLISLDGDKEAHSYRVNHNGQNSFDLVFKNVKILQAEHTDYFERRVSFNAVLHNRNSVEKVNSFIKSEFGKLPTIGELNNSSIKPDRIKEFEATYRNKLENITTSEHYHEMAEEMFMRNPQTNDLLTYLHRYSNNVFRNYNDLFVDHEKLEYTPTGTCAPFSKKMFVTVNGKILQCERIDHIFSFGQITDKEVLLDIDTIADIFNNLTGKLKKQCGVCLRNRACMQCVYYVENITNTPTPICKGYMNKEDFERYTSYCLSYLKDNPHLYKKLMTEVVLE